MMAVRSDGTTPFDLLCDNTFAEVLLFMDFESLVRFSRTTCSSLNRRCAIVGQNSALHHVWRDVFARHHFAQDAGRVQGEATESAGPVTNEQNLIDECGIRRGLVRTLVHRRTTKQNVFNLPNRHFYFVPLTPYVDDDEYMGFDRDPPPVDFDCDSFLLTSCGRSGEMALLDPFSRALTVHHHCVDNAVASDEAMMLHAMLDAAAVIRRRSSLGLLDVPDEDIAGAVFDESVYRNHNMDEYVVEPAQVLLDGQDFFLNLSHYFKLTNQRGARRRDGNMIVLHEDDQVEVGYLGIDRKLVLGKDKTVITATMIAAARNVWSEPDDRSEVLGCTEVLAWTRFQDETKFGHRRVCRFSWDFRTLEVCSKFNRLYVSFSNGRQIPFPASTVLVYPLLPFEDTDDDDCTTPSTYFPDPLFSMTCDENVSLVTVDGTGNNILVGTTKGTVEIWETDCGNHSRRVGVLGLKKCALESARRHRNRARRPEGPSDVFQKGVHPPAMTHLDDDTSDSDQVTESDSSCEAGETDDWQPNFFNAYRVHAILYPAHLPFETCGFVTLQHTRGEGSTLLLWKKPSAKLSFEVSSLVNLPLSAQRKPYVHYDGRRIIVVGQDHIGMIILIYHVLSSWEYVRYFEPPRCGNNDVKCNGDESGGLYNFTCPSRVRFANRLRHAGLGGMAYSDSIHMTCNERFLIVNTKTGNLLGGGSSLTGEGLLVIDLEDQLD